MSFPADTNEGEKFLLLAKQTGGKIRGKSSCLMSQYGSWKVTTCQSKFRAKKVSILSQVSSFWTGKKRTVTWQEHGRRVSTARDRCAGARFDPLRGVWGSFDEAPKVKGHSWHWSLTAEDRQVLPDQWDLPKNDQWTNDSVKLHLKPSISTKIFKIWLIFCSLKAKEFTFSGLQKKI